MKWILCWVRGNSRCTLILDSGNSANQLYQGAMLTMVPVWSVGVKYITLYPIDALSSESISVTNGDDKWKFAHLEKLFSKYTFNYTWIKFIHLAGYYITKYSWIVHCSRNKTSAIWESCKLFGKNWIDEFTALNFLIIA